MRRVNHHASPRATMISITITTDAADTLVWPSPSAAAAPADPTARNMLILGL